LQVEGESLQAALQLHLHAELEDGALVLPLGVNLDFSTAHVDDLLADEETTTVVFVVHRRSLEKLA